MIIVLIFQITIVEREMQPAQIEGKIKRVTQIELVVIGMTILFVVSWLIGSSIKVSLELEDFTLRRTVFT